MGARSSIFVFFFPSACYQRLFFFSLSPAADFSGLFMSSHILVVRPLALIRLLSAREEQEGRGGRFLPYTRLQTVHLGSDGRTRSALTWARVRFQTARPPVSNAEDGGVAMKSPGILLAWEIESWSFCSRKTDRLAKRKMESKCPRIRECVGNGHQHRATSTCKAGPKRLGERSIQRGREDGSPPRNLVLSASASFFNVCSHLRN